MKLFIPLAILLIAVCASAQNKIEHAPLPAKVLTAKTIFIQNDSGFAEMADKAYTQLKAWGRYEIVDSKDKADLVLILAASSTQTSGTTPTWVNMHNSQTGATTSGTVLSPSTRTRYFSHATLVDRATGDVTWSDQLIWQRKGSAIQMLIQSLQQRIEEQEKQPSLGQSRPQ